MGALTKEEQAPADPDAGQKWDQRRRSLPEGGDA